MTSARTFEFDNGQESIMLPHPFVVPHRFFPCLLRGAPGKSLVRISLVMASQASLDRAESEIFTVDGGDRHRYEKTKTIVLKRYVNSFSRTHAKSNCTLTTYKPNAGLVFNEHGVCLFEAMVDGSGGGPYEIQGQDAEGNMYATSLFVVCSEMLDVVTTPAEWEDQLEPAAEEFPKSWLKDKGAKTKTINFKVALTGPPRRLPLKARLVYSDGTLVPSQAILNVTNDHALELSEKQRQCEIRFRINEVSKNHQSKAFVVVVEPTSISEEWIAPAASYPVVIKSKVNHRTNAQMAAAAASGHLSALPANKRGRKTEQVAHSSPALQPIQLDTFPQLPSHISTRLASNSRERDEVERALQEYQAKMAKLQAKMGESLTRLFELSKQRREIEMDFTSFLSASPQYSTTAEQLLGASTSMLVSGNTMSLPSHPPPPPSLAPSTLQASANRVSSSTAMLAAAAAHIQQQQQVSSSLAQVLPPDNLWPASVSFTMDDLGKPSALFRLGSGDLMGWGGAGQSHALQVNNSTTSASKMLLSDSEENDEDDDEDEEDQPRAMDYRFMRKEFTDIPLLNRKGILAFNSALKLVGFFGRDNSFTKVTQNLPLDWRNRVEYDAMRERANLVEVSQNKDGIEKLLQVIQSAAV